MAKPTRSKSQLEALILEKARSLGVASVVRAVTVRRLRQPMADANWIVVSTNAARDADLSRQSILREIIPDLRAQFDLDETADGLPIMDGGAGETHR